MSNWATSTERDARFRAETSEYRPADPGDFRFEIIPLDEPEMGRTHLVVRVDDKGGVIESFYTDDPYGAVEAAREAQTIPLEERWEMYAERGW